MRKSFVGLVGVLCLVACGSESGTSSPAVAGPDPAAPIGPPGAPVAKAVGGDGVVKLAWEPVAGATSYEVARATTAGGEAVISNVASPSFSDADVIPETTYFYTVTAKNDAGPSAASAEVSATPISFDLLHMRHDAQVLRGVAQGNGVVVAVGDGMRALRSTDGGATWTDAHIPGYGSLWGITFGGGQFVAVGSLGEIVTSADGLTWEARTSGVTTTLYGVAYGGKANKRFVAIGEKATVLSSPDGVTWTPVTTNLHHTQLTTFDYTLRSIAYGDSATLDYFAVVAANGIGDGGYVFYVPGDGDLGTWAPNPDGNMGFLLGGPLYAITAGKYQGPGAAVSSFHVVGSQGFWGHAEETAPGKLSFGTVKAGTISDDWHGIAFDGSDTLAVFGGTKVMTCSISTSCKSGMNGWALETTTTASGFTAATYGGGELIGVGGDELVVGKAGNASFTELHRSSPSFPHIITRSVASVGDNVVAAGSYSGRYLYSTDGGMHFTSAAAPNNTSLWDVKPIGGKLFMVGDSSTILSSDTGLPGTWNVAATTPATDTLYVIASNGALSIAAGKDGCFTSSDGATWTHQTGAGRAVMNLKWDGTTFVGTTSDAHILTTVDGVTWNDVLFDQTQGMSLEGLAIEGDTIVVTGRLGHVWVSTDHAASFAPHHIAEAPTLVGLARFAGKWVGAGAADRSELWTSEDAITWQRRTGIPPTAYGVSVAADKLFVAGQYGALYSTPKL